MTWHIPSLFCEGCEAEHKPGKPCPECKIPGNKTCAKCGWCDECAARTASVGGAPVSGAVRTCQRSYVDHGYSPAGRPVRLVHVVSEEGSQRPGRWAPGSRTMCGQVTGMQRNGQSEGILRDAPHELPRGMSWCPTCVGKLADRQGRTAEVAALLGLAGGAR